MKYNQKGMGLFSRCKTYDIVDDIKDISQITNNFFPSSLIDGNAYKIIQSLCDQVLTLVPETNTGYITEKIVQITTATGMAVGTAGAGGDMAVNAVFTIKDGLIFSAKIIKVIDEIIKTVTEQGNNGETTISDDAIKFMYNFVSINFNDGIDGVKCHVQQLMKYMKSEKSKVFVCELMQKVYPEMVNFISNLMGTMIPDVGVVVKETILYVMKKEYGKNMLIKQIIKTLKTQYNKVPKKFRNMLENPDQLEKFMLDMFQGLQEFLNEIMAYIPEKSMDQKGGIFIPFSSLTTKVVGKVAKGLSSTVLNITGLDKVLLEKLVGLDNAVSQMIKNIKIVAYMINKMLALSFAMLYILLECPLQSN
jgi:hypothetical protein